jgi:hypothetical protein
MERMTDEDKYCIYTVSETARCIPLQLDPVTVFALTKYFEGEGVLEITLVPRTAAQSLRSCGFHLE